jgi:hypothetical protein
MPRKANPDTLSLLILRDGVFIADDVSADKGDQCAVDRKTALKIIENGHGQLV